MKSSLNIIIFILFSKFLLAQELKYSFHDTMVSQSDVANSMECIHYLNDESWYVLISNNPIKIEEINIKTKMRKVWSFNKYSDTKNKLNIVGNAHYVGITTADKLYLLNKLTNTVDVIKYPKDYRFSNLQFKNNDTLVAFQNYNYHIKDGFPMLQVGLLSIENKVWSHLKRLPFSGIEFTHTVNQFVQVKDDYLYYITPLGDKLYKYHLNDYSLDSFKINNNILYNENQYNRNDSITEVLISSKIKGKIVNSDIEAFNKEKIVQLRDKDSIRYRNEKLYYNGEYFIITTKPVGKVGWNERQITILDNNMNLVNTKLSILDKKVDFQKPVFVNSDASYLIKKNIIGFTEMSHFYDPTATDKEAYKVRFDEWASSQNIFYHTLFLYKLELDEK